MRSQRFLAVCAVATSLAALIAPNVVQAAAAKPGPEACAALAGRALPASSIGLPTRGAHVASAVAVPPEGQPGSPEYVPAYCNIRGEITPVDPAAPPIKFGLALPDRWNGNSIQIGGNGQNGFVPWLAALNRNGGGSPFGPAMPPNAPYPIAQGYATYGDDSGHSNGTGTGPGGPHGISPPGAPAGPVMGDPGWMNNAESFRNYAYENVKKDYDVAQTLIAVYYGRTPRFRYFMGESHGGRQALEAIARYGDGFDGVLVSVPLVNFAMLQLSPVLRGQWQKAPGAWVPPAKWATVERETVRRCDGLDGLKDGVINNYLACDRLFDPTITKNSLAAIRCAGGADTGVDCLSDAQIAIVERFRAPIDYGYALPTGETRWAGEPAGGESTLALWLMSRADPAGSPETPVGPLNDAAITSANFGLAADEAQIKALAAAIDAPLDWSRFLRKGGKVIYHVGANDYLTNGRNQMSVYESLQRTTARALIDKGARFYVTPGGDHGSRSYSFPDKSPQPMHSDLIGVLERWVEHGQAPPDAVKEMLMDVKAPYAIAKERPLCRYPAYPRYKGAGDPNRYESYSCTKP